MHIVQGSAIKGITKDDLLSKEISVPDYEEQEQIGTYLSNLDNLIALHQRKHETLKEIKKYMLQNMFPKN
jgi:type I restriction enzyme S subunit